jgi:hypothetical protein
LRPGVCFVGENWQVGFTQLEKGQGLALANTPIREAAAQKHGVTQCQNPDLFLEWLRALYELENRGFLDC